MPFRQDTRAGQGRSKYRNRRRTRNRIEAGNNSKRRDTIPAGFCFCTNCGETIPHKAGVACRLSRYPKCGKKMLRDSPWQVQL